MFAEVATLSSLMRLLWLLANLGAVNYNCLPPKYDNLKQHISESKESSSCHEAKRTGS